MEWWYWGPLAVAVVLFLLVGTVFERRVEAAFHRVIELSRTQFLTTAPPTEYVDTKCSTTELPHLQDSSELMSSELRPRAAWKPASCHYLRTASIAPCRHAVASAPASCFHIRADPNPAFGHLFRVAQTSASCHGTASTTASCHLEAAPAPITCLHTETEPNPAYEHHYRTAQKPAPYHYLGTASASCRHLGVASVSASCLHIRAEHKPASWHYFEATNPASNHQFSTITPMP